MCPPGRPAASLQVRSSQPRASRRVRDRDTRLTPFLAYSSCSSCLWQRSHIWSGCLASLSQSSRGSQLTFLSLEGDRYSLSRGSSGKTWPLTPLWEMAAVAYFM